MSKLTVILGKRIGLLADKEVEDAGLRHPSPIDRLRYPELRLTRWAGMVPQHPDDFIPRTMSYILSALNEGRDVQLWTMSEYLVNTIGGAIGLGPLNHQDVEIRLYEDDNASYTTHTFNENGFLQAGWPIGWFMPSL